MTQVKQNKQTKPPIARTTSALSHAVMCLFFLWSAWVQRNDPDYFNWISVYLIAAALSFLTILKWKDILILCTIACSESLIAAIILFVTHMETIRKLGIINVEEGRESLGLFIISIEMLFCALTNAADYNKIYIPNKIKVAWLLLPATVILGTAAYISFVRSDCS